MADGTIERQGFHIRVKDNGDGTFLIATHDLGGGLLATDQPLEIQGYLIQLHDNGDGTFSVVTTQTQGATDVTIEHEGFHMRLHPTGASFTVGGISKPMYAVVVVQV